MTTGEVTTRLMAGSKQIRDDMRVWIGAKVRVDSAAAFSASLETASVGNQPTVIIVTENAEWLS